MRLSKWCSSQLRSLKTREKYSILEIIQISSENLILEFHIDPHWRNSFSICTITSWFTTKCEVPKWSSAPFIFPLFSMRQMDFDPRPQVQIDQFYRCGRPISQGGYQLSKFSRRFHSLLSAWNRDFKSVRSCIVSSRDIISLMSRFTLKEKFCPSTKAYPLETRRELATRFYFEMGKWRMTTLFGCIEKQNYISQLWCMM